jgi:hypothetical protein
MMIIAAVLFAATTFNPPCKLPFAPLGKPQPIDSKCGMLGDAASKPALAAQDGVKNNFCATGTPVVLTFDLYSGLQAAAEKILGVNYEPPTDRTKRRWRRTGSRSSRARSNGPDPRVPGRVATRPYERAFRIFSSRSRISRSSPISFGS